MSDISASDGLHLGPGMARRSRSQSVLATHRTAATLVGAVGRASVGFGLAIGRSRSIRPIVNLSDVNSAALRPPTNFWREPISEYEVGDTEIGGTATGSSFTDESAIGARIPVERQLVRRLTNTGQRSVSRATAAPSSVSRKSRRPTWTDQIIQRSAVGYTSAPTGSLVERPAVPDDFVPFGDAAVDHLRLLMRANESSSTQASATDRQVARRLERDSVRANQLTASRASRGSESGALRGDTAAGRSTAPGHLAKAMRPEQITNQSTARVSARPGPGSTVGADLPAAGRRADPAASRRSSRRPAAAPSKMDTLRALLVEQGILSGGSEDAQPASSDVVPAGGAPAGGAPAGGGIAAGATRVAGAATTSADLARSVQRNAEQRRDVRSGRPSADASVVGPGSRRPVSPPQAAPTGSAPTGSAPAGSAPTRSDGGSSVATAESRADVPRVDAPNPPRDVAGLRRRALRMVSATSEPARRDAAGEPRPGRNVDGAVTEPAAPQWGQSAPLERVGSAGLQRTSAHGSHRVLPWAAQQPVLRSLSPAPMPGAAVLRRVTLPRALSFSHRPAPTLGTARVPSIGVVGAVRPESGIAGISARTVGAVIARADVVRPTLWDMADTPPVVDRPVVSDRPQSVRASVAPLVEPDTSRVRSTAAPTTDDRAVTLGAHVARRRSVLAASSGALGQAIQRRAAMTEPSASPVRQALAVPGVRTPFTPGTPAAGTTAPGGTSAVVAPTTGAAATLPQGLVATTSVAGSAPRSATSVLGGAVARRPAEHLADQFMTELSQTIRRTPAPLPMPYRPMADTITGGRRVVLSTDGASRRALRSVGKVAATTDNTIHLDTASVAPGRMSEVIAHELTHVAHPSSRPRFFDDIDHSPEERQAEQVAKIMARSPLAPSASVVTPVGVERRAASTIRRSPVSNQSSGSAPGTVDAASLAARITGASGSPTSPGSPVIRRELVESPTPSSTPTSSPSSSGNPTASPMSDHEFLNLVRANLPDVVGMIEDRLIIELERRGGRTWGVL